MAEEKIGLVSEQFSESNVRTLDGRKRERERLVGTTLGQ